MREIREMRVLENEEIRVMRELSEITKTSYRHLPNFLILLISSILLYASDHDINDDNTSQEGKTECEPGFFGFKMFV